MKKSIFGGVNISLSRFTKIFFFFVIFEFFDNVATKNAKYPKIAHENHMSKD